MAANTRIERDSMGELEVSATALYGAQTQRAVNNFPISGQRLPRGFLRALGLIKAAAAQANVELGLLDEAVGEAIVTAAAAVAAGEHDGQFPVDVFQTGSGTSSNMNANEVIARLAGTRLGADVHANDQVNLGQSSNDVIPSAIQIGACLALEQGLLPALAHLRETIARRAMELDAVIKTGRTHLMDAMPLSLGQELRTWAGQIELAEQRLDDGLSRARRLPQGGTAVGTGINAHPAFAATVCRHLSALAGCEFRPAENLFVGIAGQDAALELSGHLNSLAAALMKICNDLRWMNSGPLAGLGEVELPALQPGSSIMPGKVNPVLPEAMAMLCAQVMGSHHSIGIAAQSGNFQLNVMLPMIAWNLLNSIDWLSNGVRLLADHCIAGFSVREDRLRDALQRNPILVTALNPLIGYDKAAAIAKRAYREGRPIIDVAREDSGLSEDVLRDALDPAQLIRGGIAGD